MKSFIYNSVTKSFASKKYYVDSNYNRNAEKGAWDYKGNSLMVSTKDKDYGDEGGTHEIISGPYNSKEEALAIIEKTHKYRKYLLGPDGKPDYTKPQMGTHRFKEKYGPAYDLASKAK